MVYLLGCALENRHESLRCDANVLSQALIKVQQQLHVHFDKVAAFSSISLQLLSMLDKQKLSQYLEKYNSEGLVAHASRAQLD